MASVVARIALRYLAGLLVAKGLLDAGMGKEFAADTELLGLVEAGLGLAAATAAEWWYVLARKFGWSK